LGVELILTLQRRIFTLSFGRHSGCRIGCIIDIDPPERDINPVFRKMSAYKEEEYSEGAGIRAED